MTLHLTRTMKFWLGIDCIKTAVLTKRSHLLICQHFQWQYYLYKTYIFFSFHFSSPHVSSKQKERVINYFHRLLWSSKICSMNIEEHVENVLFYQKNFTKEIFPRYWRTWCTIYKMKLIKRHILLQKSIH